MLRNIFLILRDADSEVLDVIVDLTCLFTNRFLHVLHETRPLVSSVAFFNVGGEQEAIASLLQKTKTAHHDFELVVEDASLVVLQLNLGVHNLLVRLRDNSNQEIKQNNEDENLIQNPEKVNGVNHEEGRVVLEYGGS